MHIPRSIAFFLLLAQKVLAQQPTPILPDPKLTPQDAFEVTVEDIYVSGYAKKVRNVPAENAKFTRSTASHLMKTLTTTLIIDRLVPLEVGGSNSIKNLWPES
jgi:hypothetical protein